MVRAASASLTLFPPAHRSLPITLARHRIVDSVAERLPLRGPPLPPPPSVRRIKLPPQATARGRHAEVAMNDELAARHRAITLRLAGRPVKAICAAVARSEIWFYKW